MAIMPPALIVTGHLKTLVARVRHAGGAVSEILLIWLALHELFASLERLFTAWRNGELPPMPTPVPEIHTAPQPRPTRRRQYTRAPRAPGSHRRTATPASATPAARPVRPSFHPASPAQPKARNLASDRKSQKFNTFRLLPNHALFVPVT